MPTYVYQCKKCDTTFEIEQRISEDPLKNCKCGAKGSLRRLIQPVAVLFNGPGFHVNDYASKSGKSEIGTKEASKPDSKPATGCGSDSCACKSDAD